MVKPKNNIQHENEIQIWIDVKETIISALTLCGVLVAAGYYNTYYGIAPKMRWKRETLDDIQVPDFEPHQTDGQHHFFNNQELKSIINDDVGNITEETWKQMQLDLGIAESEVLPFEIEEEDISTKQKKKMVLSKGSLEEFRLEDVNKVTTVGRPVRTKPGRPQRYRKEKITIRKFKLQDIPLLHVPMQNTHKFRQNVLMKKFIDDAWIWHARIKPVELLTPKERKRNRVYSREYPDYRGSDRTHPQIQNFLDEFDYKEDGSKLFEGANTQLWFALQKNQQNSKNSKILTFLCNFAIFSVSAAVPLFPEDKDAPIEKYENYYKMVENFKPALNAAKGGSSTIRLSIGLFHKGGIFAPRGAIYRANRFPWGRIKTYYSKPRTATSMPYLIETADSMLKWMNRFGPSTD